MAQQRLTKRFIDSLKLPPGRAEAAWYDSDVQGFGVRLRQPTSGQAKPPYFFVRYRNLSGKDMKATIGFYGQWTVEQARERARELIQAGQRGQDPAVERRRRLAEETYQSAFDRFIQERSRGQKPLSATTVRTYTTTHKNRIVKLLGDKRLSEITKADVLSVRAACYKDAKYREGDKAVNLIRTLYKWLQEHDYDLPNPAQEIKVPQTKVATKALEAWQVAPFFAAIDGEPNETARDLLHVLLFTGVRKTNALEMEWKDLNLSQATWFIPKTKNREPLRVALTPEIVEILQRRRRQAESKPSPYVFPNRLDPTRPYVNIRDPLLRVLARAEIILLKERITAAGRQLPLTGKETEAKALELLRNFAAKHHVDVEGTRLFLRVHDLRATNATAMASEGRTAVEIAKALGQKTLTMANRYVKHSEQMATKATHSAASWLRQAAGRGAVPESSNGH